MGSSLELDQMGTSLLFALVDAVVVMAGREWGTGCRAWWREFLQPPSRSALSSSAAPLISPPTTSPAAVESRIHESYGQTEDRNTTHHG